VGVSEGEREEVAMLPHQSKIAAGLVVWSEWGSGGQIQIRGKEGGRKKSEGEKRLPTKTGASAGGVAGRRWRRQQWGGGELEQKG